jgi:metallophosphoesterase superfamily enzyme
MIRAEIQPGVWLDSRRALFIEPLRLLVVSDLHWGYVESHRAQGNLLPLWGDAQIARDLDALLVDYQPSAQLWLGDSLHTLKGRAAAESYLAACPVPVTVVPGNHDARWEHACGPRWVQRDRFVFHHGDAAAPTELPPGTIEIIGHHHPAFAWRDGAGARLKFPAFIRGESRWIMPAFSPWAAGTPWNETLGEIETLWVLAPKRLFALTADFLRR